MKIVCNYRHTAGSKIAPWVRGDNEMAEVIVLQNGQRQTKLRCRSCGTLSSALPWLTVLEWMSDLGTPVIRAGHTYAHPECSYRGCTEAGIEMHHFGPRNTFGDDAENWPVMALCHAHHFDWHQTMDGYRWHRKGIAS